MLLKYFYDNYLAQASYMVGCPEYGEAMIVDPARDIRPYIAAAAEHGLRIMHITETHIHADFVSGARELAVATGGALYLSDMDDSAWKYEYAAEDRAILVKDGDTWMVGNVRVAVLHTPGHTPEHIVFMITDTAGADRPMGIFTGDFVFVGDVGRPDLLETAAGFAGTKDPGARQQFQSVARIKKLPDYLQLWPGHGAGSACGKSLGAIPSTTLGYEKLFSPAFQFTNETAFVNWLLDGQPEVPRYFAHMKHVNKHGPSLLRDRQAPRHLDRAALDRVLAEDAFVVDFRNRQDFARGFVRDTVSIPATDNDFSTYVGWFVNYDAPLYFIIDDESGLDKILTALRAIGVDNTPGYFTADALDEPLESLPTISAAEVAARLRTEDLMIVDVRGASEYTDLHVEGAVHIPLGFLPAHLNELPRDRLIVTQCSGGYRSHIAASLLRRHGFRNVVSLSEGKQVWAKALVTARESLPQ